MDRVVDEAAADAGALTLLVADDEPLAVERMQILLGRMAGVRLLGAASDGEQAVRMAEALTPDALLLDIAMPGMTGMEAARALAALPNPPAVVFVTAFDGFAVAAFELAAVDYVMKPVEPDRLARALDRVRVRRASPAAPAAPVDAHAREFWVPHRGELVRLDVDMIERVEAERDYMRLVTPHRSFLIHATMEEMEARLDPVRFLRVHRSTILRRDRITGLRHEGLGVWSALTTCGGAWRIGRSHLANVKALAGR